MFESAVLPGMAPIEIITVRVKRRQGEGRGGRGREERDMEMKRGERGRGEMGRGGEEKEGGGERKEIWRRREW